MGEIDTFGEYVRSRLEEWGGEFALSRDCEYLGHQSRNILQVLIEHRGEMPGRTQGFKPLEVNQSALQVEIIVADIARRDMRMASILRAYYCGSGRKKVERYETALLLSSTAGAGTFSVRKYLQDVEAGNATVRSLLLREARAA